MDPVADHQGKCVDKGQISHGGVVEFTVRTHAEFLTIRKDTGCEFVEFHHSGHFASGQETELCEEMQAGGWDPISGDERTRGEGLEVVVRVVNNPVYDLRRNRRSHRHRRF